MELNKIYIGNNIEILKTFPDESINCCITSPPYYGLRDYGTGTWVGGDPSCPHKRITHRSDNCGTGHAQPELQGNVAGDIYKKVCPKCGAVRKDNQVGLEETPEEYVSRLVSIFNEVKRVLTKDGTLWINIGDSYSYINEGGLKKKDMIGIPWMLALALRKDGWYLRQDIIWHKPNPMPEPVEDRCTRAHEYIFLLSKSPYYYFDFEANREQTVDNKLYESRTRRDVWSIPVSTFKDAHFATYPETLVSNCLLVGCPKDGVVLDPFMGSGTTGVVAKRENRNYVGIELNPKYAEMANKRLSTISKKLF